MDLPTDPSEDDLHYVYENQVRFAETDMQGVVFYGEYVTYQDETLSEFLRAIGFPYGELEGLGADFHVVHVAVDYHSTAGFDDWLVNGIRVERIGQSSIDFAWASRGREDDRVVATGELTHVTVDAEAGEPVRVPEEFRTAVREFQEVLPET